MKIKSAEFIISNTELSKCPKPDKPEYAFIGRSNVGKSSLINMLTDRKSLAKTSSKPGKTQLINHFLINDSWFLVDLPGYGWAQVSKTQKQQWGKMIKGYLLKRENLHCVFVLVDSRHSPQKVDLEFLSWLGENQVPLALIFTKGDKQGKTKLQSNIAQYRKILKNQWEELPPYFATSATNALGKSEVLDYIDQINQQSDM